MSKQNFQLQQIQIVVDKYHYYHLEIFFFSNIIKKCNFCRIIETCCLFKKILFKRRITILNRWIKKLYLIFSVFQLAMIRIHVYVDFNIILLSWKIKINAIKHAGKAQYFLNKITKFLQKQTLLAVLQSNATSFWPHDVTCEIQNCYAFKSICFVFNSII